MSCRCIRGQDSHFTFRKEKKKIRNKEVGLQESAEGRAAGSPLPFSLSLPSQLSSSPLLSRIKKLSGTSKGTDWRGEEAL